MRFPALWAAKSVLLMRIFIDHKAGFVFTTINFLMQRGAF